MERNPNITGGLALCENSPAGGYRTGSLRSSRFAWRLRRFPQDFLALATGEPAGIRVKVRQVSGENASQPMNRIA
jgi:hypothetical protein